MVLAQLLSFVPYPVRARIRKRCEEIVPSEAGEIRSLVEVQARIEALLSAGIIDAAAQFMDHEQGLRTWGNVAGRGMTQLRTTLRLLLLKGDWAEIRRMAVPTGFSEPEKTTAS